MLQNAYEITQQASPTGMNEVLDSSTSYFNKPTSDDRQNLIYLIQKEVEDELQPPLRDISYGFARGLTDMLYTGKDDPFPTRKQALDYFEREFWTDGIIRTKGNMAKLARESGRSREKLYDKFRNHDIIDLVDKARPWKDPLLEDKVSIEYFPPDRVEDTLTGVLSGYKSVINDNTYSDITLKIKEKAPVLAEKISPYAPTPAKRLDELMSKAGNTTNYREAKNIFEREIIYDALEAAGFDRGKAAEYLDETRDNLNKRIKALGIDTKNTVSTTDFAKKQSDEPVKREDLPAPLPEAVGEVERFQQLVQEYNAKRDDARKRKETTTRQQKCNTLLAA